MKLVRALRYYIVLLLTEDSTGGMLRDVSYQSVQLGESLVAGVAVVVVLTLELAERSAATQLRSVQGVK